MPKGLSTSMDIQPVLKIPDNHLIEPESPN